MSHTALARKYRPRRFGDVSAQRHVSDTLRRAVASGRVGHAYLFSGPRGVGKTTLARVLAMALNCPERSGEGEPCGTCASCDRIWSGHTALDVVEIDAASNRGVDDARELRERAMYAPSESDRYKVYIVDEAHMLTREAWNALLKILEEPPPRVIFVFATTEPQKIEQTAAPILSRCQRFDFRRVGMAEIVARLRQVLETEGVLAPDEALRLLARKADGGMRDALSLTDQVLALSDEDGVTAEVARRVLGMVDDDRYLALFDLLADGRRGDLFGYVQDLVDEGYDLVEFHHGLLDALRILLRLRLDGGEVPELPGEGREAWEARARRFAPGDLVRMLGLAGELEGRGGLRQSAQPRVLVELLLLRLAYLDRTVELEELIRALGGPADPGAVDGGAADGGPGKGEDPPEPERRAGNAAAQDVRPSPGTPSAEGPPDESPRPTGGPLAEPSASEGPPAESSPPETPPAESSPSGGPSAESSPPEAPSPPAVGVLDAWTRLLEGGEGLPRGLGPFLRAARVEAPGDGRIRVILPPGPGAEMLQDTRRSAGLRKALAHHLGRAPTLEVVEDREVADRRVTPEKVQEGELEELVAREPGLREAVEELDLELRD